MSGQEQLMLSCRSVTYAVAIEQVGPSRVTPYSFTESSAVVFALANALVCADGLYRAPMPAVVG